MSVLLSTVAFCEDNNNFKQLNYEIILPRNPTKIELFATKELSTFFCEIFGKTIVLNRSQDRIRFFVGISKAATKVGLTENLSENQEFGIFRQGRNFLLYGQDDDVPAFGKGREQFGSTGTLLAVYYFLTKYADVNFLFPGKHGIFIKKNPQLIFKGVKDIPKPSFEVRGFSMDTDEFTSRECALFRKRMLCTRPLWSGDGGIYTYYNWRSRFEKTHPEYFIMSEKGKRRFNIRRNMCFSNKEVLMQTAQDLVRLFRQRKCKSVVFLADIPYLPCFCKTCKESRERSFVKEMDGYSEEYFVFVDRLAKLVNQTLPDVRLVTHTKWSSYQWPPKTIKWKPEIPVRIITHRNDMTPGSRMSESLELMCAWKDTGCKNIMYSYCRLPPFKNYPIIWHKYTANLIRKVHGYTDGTYCGDQFGKSPYSFSALNNYIQAKFLFDKDQDAVALVKQFVAYVYPGAENEMFAFYEEMERVLMTKRAFQMNALADVYQVENLRKPMKFLQEAGRKLTGNKFLYNKLYTDFYNFFEVAKEKSPELAGSMPREFDIPVTNKPVQIDGNISEEEWQGKLKVHFACPLVANIHAEKAEYPQHSIAYLLRDKKNLYIGLKAFEDEIGQLTQNYKVKPDADIWKDDSFEMFLSLSETGYPYYQIIVNSLGRSTFIKYERKMVRAKRQGNLKFNTVGKIYKNCYEIELMLPLSQFPEKSLSQTWRFNIFRDRKLLENRQYSGLSYIGGGFHNIEIAHYLNLTAKNAGIK